MTSTSTESVSVSPSLSVTRRVTVTVCGEEYEVEIRIPGDVEALRMISKILKNKGHEVVSVAPGDTVLSVARVLTERGIGAALVCDAAGALLGIISERDIVRGMANQGQGTTQLPAERLMTRGLVTVTRNTALAEALELVTRHRVRHLPVIEGGELVGLVSIGDLVKSRIDEAEHEAAALKDYVVSPR